MQRDVRGILSRLPKTLDETYERVLRDIHDDNKEHARRLLHSLAVAIRPLRVEELAEILAFDFDAVKGGIPEYHADWRWKDQEEAVLTTCSSLITVDCLWGSTRVVQFSHFSVKEFLMADRLATPTRDISHYHILPEPAHTILAQACLGFLLHLDGLIEAGRTKDFPLAAYAAEHWVTHAQFQDVVSHVKCGMKDLFDSDKPYFASWVGRHNMDMDNEPQIFAEYTLPKPLYYSALCGFHDIANDLAIKYPRHVNAIGGQYDTPLAAALCRGHLRVAELLLDHGTDFDVHGTSGRTPVHTLLLHMCHAMGSVITGVRLLLKRGANPNARDKGYQTPLYMLSLHRSRSCDVLHRRYACVLVAIQLLIEHGADVNARDKENTTPLLFAMQHEKLNDAQILLEHHADPNLIYEGGKTLLHLLFASRISAGSGLGEILVFARQLLKHGAAVNVRDDAHHTPLLLAMQHGTSDIVRSFLEHGADPNLVYEEGKTLLHLLLRPHASIGRSVVDWPDKLLIARLLLKHGAGVNVRDDAHNTPLLLAMQHGTSDIVRCLLEHGADPNLVYKEGKTLLHLDLGPHRYSWRPVTGRSDDHLVAELLLKHGADANARDDAHNTPLLLAMQLGTSHIVRSLLEHGADPNVVYEEGKTLLHLELGPHGSSWRPVTTWSDDHLVAELLLEHGADANARDDSHKTPLLLAMRHRTSSIVRCLLEHGADPNLVYEEGKTLLHLLSGSRGSNWRSLTDRPGDLLVEKLSPEHGVNMNARDHVSKTSSLLVMRREAPSIASFLLQHGANPNMEDNEGNTPLHTLLLERDDNNNDNDVLILQLLLKLGADTSARNKNHGTPLDLAPYYGEVLTAQVLLHTNMSEGEYPHKIVACYPLFNRPQCGCERAR